MEVLTVCDGCSRHVKFHETQCPFCGAAMGERAMPMVNTDPGAPRGLSRGRAFVAAAVMASASLSVAACYGGAPVSGDGRGVDSPIPTHTAHCTTSGDTSLCGLSLSADRGMLWTDLLGHLVRMEGVHPVLWGTAFASPSSQLGPQGQCLGLMDFDTNALRRVLASSLSAELTTCDPRNRWVGAQAIPERTETELRLCDSVAVGPSLERSQWTPAVCNSLSGEPLPAFANYGAITSFYLVGVRSPLQTPTPVVPDRSETATCRRGVERQPVDVSISDDGREYIARHEGWRLFQVTSLRRICAELHDPRR